MNTQENTLRNNSLLDFLDADSYQTYNRNIARYCKSVNAAILLSELANRYKYHSKRNELTDSSAKYGAGWFYYTFDHCEERTCLTEKEQENGIKILQDLGFIQKCQMGMPSKRHFKIDMEKIAEAFHFSNNLSRTYEKGDLDRTKGENKEGRKGRTAHIYKNPKEDPYEEPPPTSSKDSGQNSSDNSGGGGIKNSSEGIIYKNGKGEVFSAQESDIYKHFLKFPYPTSIIKESIDELKKNTGPINNLMKFLEAICYRLLQNTNTKNVKENIDVDLNPPIEAILTPEQIDKIREERRKSWKK